MPAPLKLRMMRFLLISATAHFIFAVLSEFLFEVRPAPQAKPKISVRLIKSAPLPNRDFPWGKIVDTLPPAKEEKPAKAAILSAFDSKAHAPKIGPELLFDKTSIPEKKAFPSNMTARPAPLKRPATSIKIKETQKPQTETEQPLQTASLPNPFMKAKALREEAVEREEAKIKYKKELEQISPRPEPRTGETVNHKTLPEKEVPEGDRLMSGEEVDFFIENNRGETLETRDELVISLNTQKLEYLAYFSAVRRAVESVWFYPDRAMINGVGGLALVRFTIGVDGWMEEAKIVSSSGEEVLDKASLMAIRNASPFPAFPATLLKKRVHVVATFTYKPVFGAIP